MILVHDDDLMYIYNASYKVIRRPQRAMPEVWPVQCGGSEAKTPILKVATLSQNPFGPFGTLAVSQPLAVPASNLRSPPNIGEDLFSPPPNADHNLVGTLTTPFDKPGQSSHAPQEDHKQKQPIEQTMPSANTPKYDAATEAQSEDRRTPLRWKLSRKVGLTRLVKSLVSRKVERESSKTESRVKEEEER